MRNMNMCHDIVHDLAQVIEPTCTSNHAHPISNLYAHNPHYAQLVEIKHSVCMPALHSRDAYDYGCTARRDRMTNHRRDRLHMTHHSRDNTP